jgi:hypothetical protein
VLRRWTFAIYGISSLSFAFFAPFADKITDPNATRRREWPNVMSRLIANHRAALWQNPRTDRSRKHA